MAFATGDGAVAYKFAFKIDGITCPSVIDVSGLKLEVEMIETKTQTADGKLVISHVPGAYKPGEITVTRQLTDDLAISDWLGVVMKGDPVAARKSATVDVFDLTSAKIKSYQFTNVWVKSVETSQFKAGSNEPLTEKFTMTWTEATVTK
jgi:phage tail-like protein